MVEEDESKRTEKILDALRLRLVARFGSVKGDQIYREILATTKGRVGPNASIAVADLKTTSDIIDTLLQEGDFGIGAAKLLRFDNLLNNQKLKHATMERFLRHYLQEEEYMALLASFTLVELLSDPSSSGPNFGRMVRELYTRLGELRYGRKILKQVSTKRLMDITYPTMRHLETKLSPAGRLPPASSEAEMVRQIFYRSLEFDPTKLWLSSGMDSADAFDKIHQILTDPTRSIPFLDVHGAGPAWELAKGVARYYAETYDEYSAIDVPQPDNANAGYVRIQKK